MAGNRGLSDEELFLNKPANEGDSPTVTIEPLRIHKPQSPRPNDRFKYPPPAGASTSATASKQPSFALPPGASSSANPLPYPDDDDHRIGQSSRPSRPPYPDDGVRKNSGSSTKSSSQQPAYNDTTPRLNTSPSEKKGPGLAERRGTAPQPLSPQSPGDDKDSNLFARPIQNPQKGGASATSSSHSTASSYPSYTKKLYYPPPSVDEGPGPGARMESSVNRYASTASTSTTRATRGSPPPPETPVAEPGSGIPGGGIEARYAAAGISGTETLSALQSQSAAAAQRLAQYGGAPPTTTQVVTAPPRPWTPTESPGQNPHGPPTVYQGAQPISSPQPISNSAQAALAAAAAQPHGGGTMQISTLEQDFQRIQLNKTPPPAYSSLGLSSSGYPNEKGRPAQQQAASTKPATTNASANSKPAMAAAAVPVAGGVPSAVAGGPMAGAAATAGLQGHPAFANDPKPETLQNGHPSQHATAHMADPAIAAAVTSPPPLPEGWIAHLDQNSGQYYYIHLATQATQWEFPKGPNPLHHDPTPLSPTASTYGNPMTSPMFGKAGVATPLFAPQTPGYAESIMSVAQTTGGFSGPPPSAGVDLYKIQPTNGVYFGPYLRYVNMDVEKGIWLGSIMIITDAPQPPTVHLHLSVDLSPNPLQLVPHAIYTHQRWVFYKFDIELKMGENGTERWTYAVTSHLGCTRYEFVVAGRNELGWRFIAHSGNDFATSTSQADRSKLGGVGFMWKDVLQKNVECGGFHVQLGLGDQIYGDRLWKEVPLLKQWLSMSGRENRKNAAWTARHEEDVTHAYFHYYTSHFDQPYLREAFAQIPHILQIDDHDIFDGFGSYPDYMQNSQMFKNIGRIAIEMYLLFQHHTTLEMLRNVNTDLDLFTITGTGWHFVKYLGPAVVVVGPDCRSERTTSRVMAGPTYQGIFPKVALLPPSVQHCIWMVSGPIVYPRLETVESLANTIATGKKAVNTTYNIVGKLTSSVAGVVGQKDVVQQGFSHVKKAVGKAGLMGTVLNQFGDLDIVEKLKDLWTHDSKDLERTYLIRTLQGIAQQKGIRMTFLSGDVNCCGAGLVHDPSHPSDHKTMYQIISSPIVAAPMSNYILKMLHNNKALYVPQNGHKSTHEVSDTKEDMMEIFHTDASGAARDLKKLMGRRNYVAFVAYDPEAVPGSQHSQNIANGTGFAKLSLAVDFVVQGDGAFAGPTKYGPVIIPHLEYGH